MTYINDKTKGTFIITKCTYNLPRRQKKLEVLRRLHA